MTKCLLVFVILFMQGLGLAQTLPVNAEKYLPLLKEEQVRFWSDHPRPETLAAQVEQETCISLKHRKCWSPYAELKTDREYGFGLGQITRTARFDVFTEIKVLDPSLKAWRWEDRFNPQYQLRALVLKDKQSYSRIVGSATASDRLAFTYAAYNGGMGGVLSDRRLCAATPGCDQSVWFGNVEHTSNKAKKPLKGYGKSFFEIVREYVVNVLVVRPGKYSTFFEAPVE